MNDMRSVIIPKSDQLNADSLIGGPMTITINKVVIKAGSEQPVSVSFDGDDNKPWKPCKSMCKVMVSLWGPDANEYVGHSMTLYADPKVLWGGMAVGGIRISHMSDIKAEITMALTATKGNKKPFTVKPLVVAQAKKTEPRMGIREVLAAALKAAVSEDEVAECALIPAIAKILTDGPANQRDALQAMMAEAFKRFAPADDEGPVDDEPHPGDAQEGAA